MLVWDGLVIIAALWDGMRLPAPQLITVDRSWNNAPSLDSQTEIDLGVEQRGGTILYCRVVDDLPDAFVAAPATHSSVPTVAPRQTEAIGRAPSQPGNGLFSSGRSATNRTATTVPMMRICATLITKKLG